MGSLWHTFAPSPLGFVSSTVAHFVLNFILPAMTHEWGNIQVSLAWIQKWPKLIYAWKGSALLKPHHVDVLYEPSLGSVSPESSFGRSGWLYPTLTGPKLAFWRLQEFLMVSSIFLLTLLVIEIETD